jgi:MioC protein
MNKHFEIIVGTMLGAAEYVADALAETVKQKGFTYTIHLEPNLENISTSAHWLVCTSTHGAGELPDNIQPFAAQLNNADLSSVSAYIVGLGDTSYDTFCYGAKTMESLITGSGGTLNTAPLHVDVLEHPIPEDIAKEWFEGELDPA